MQCLKVKVYKRLIRLISAAVISLAASYALAADIDNDSGLIMAPGWETVKTNCTICHSAKFITAQRGDRETWTSMIRWMQKTQGLWQFPPDVENTILDYLATNYPPGKPSRRQNLSPADMPPPVSAK